MKILHTSDWHIGKRLMERERLLEQEEALSEIAAVCDENGVELVLVAGDVFDTYMPSADAEELFYRAIKKIAGENRAVLIISGNHDDGIRLAASAPFSQEHGVYFFGNRPAEIRIGGSRSVRVVEAGAYYAVVENAKGERVYVNALPYPNEARFKEDKTEETYSEKIARWIARGEEGYRGDTFHILLSHLFAAGGSVSESERNIDLGGARAVPLSLLPKEGYVALGHLHRPQRQRNAYYSGSILQYSFDEANTVKRVLLLETKGKEYTVEEIPLRSGKKLVRLESNGVCEALNLLNQTEDVFVELTLNLTAPLTSEETKSLMNACPGLVSLIPRVKCEGGNGIVRRASLTETELFCQYYESRFGQAPDDALVEQFLLLLTEEEA